MSSHDNSKPTTSAREERLRRREKYKQALEVFESDKSASISNSPWRKERG
jgi:hypothetical protein